MSSKLVKAINKIKALFGGPGGATALSVDELPERKGRAVLVRSSGSGVWVGTLRSRCGTSVYLTEARRVWDWTGAAECSALALRGPKSGKIGEPTTPIVHGVDEEHLLSDAAIAAFAGVAPWVA